jgi:AP-4 complex subunit sigma-1
VRRRRIPMKVDFVLFVNRRLQTRLVQYYFDEQHGFAPLSMSERAVLERKVARACLRRKDAQTPFFELDEQLTITYRRYASLYIVIGMRKRENALAVREFAHAIIETLNEVFDGHVSELDLLFGADKVHSTLDYMLANGFVVETARPSITTPVKLIDSL